MQTPEHMHRLDEGVVHALCGQIARLLRGVEAQPVVEMPARHPLGCEHIVGAQRREHGRDADAVDGKAIPKPAQTVGFLAVVALFQQAGFDFAQQPPIVGARSQQAGGLAQQTQIGAHRFGHRRVLDLDCNGLPVACHCRLNLAQAGSGKWHRFERPEVRVDGPELSLKNVLRKSRLHRRDAVAGA